MKVSPLFLAGTLVCMLCSFSAVSFAEPQPKTPPKAAPRAPLSKPGTVDSVVKSPTSNAMVKPPKPIVATAVAPKLPAAPVGQKSIIFVGGKPGDGKASLNTQPIPPGKVGPADPIR